MRCAHCPELRAYAADVGRTKKAQYRDWTYWGRPVPAFGDPQASVVLVGLAPGAHGSNRTGRMFTGDASGVWLYRALWKAGYANQPHQASREDGLVLTGCFITAALRCAPPQNKPTPAQLRRCAPYLHAELALLERMRVVVGLGAIGSKSAYDALRELGYRFEGRFVFGHGREIDAVQAETGRRVTLLMSYHPSRQNTNTGVLTEEMLDAVFLRSRRLLERTTKGAT